MSKVPWCVQVFWSPSFCLQGKRTSKTSAFTLEFPWKRAFCLPQKVKQSRKRKALHGQKKLECNQSKTRSDHAGEWQRRKEKFGWDACSRLKKKTEKRSTQPENKIFQTKFKFSPPKTNFSHHKCLKDCHKSNQTKLHNECQSFQVSVLFHQNRVKVVWGVSKGQKNVEEWSKHVNRPSNSTKKWWSKPLAQTQLFTQQKP